MQCWLYPHISGMNALFSDLISNLGEIHDQIEERCIGAQNVSIAAMRVFACVSSTIAAAIFETTKMTASDSQCN